MLKQQLFSNPILAILFSLPVSLAVVVKSVCHLREVRIVASAFKEVAVETGESDVMNNLPAAVIGLKGKWPKSPALTRHRAQPVEGTFLLTRVTLAAWKPSRKDGDYRVRRGLHVEHAGSSGGR